MPDELIEQLESLGLILLTPWQTWWDESREEYRFHCDLLLPPGALVKLEALPEGGWFQCAAQEARIYSRDKWTKVHLAMSWEHRDGPFVKGESE